MNRTSIVVATLVVAMAACGGQPEPELPAPVVDSTAIREQARRDSIEAARQAREAAERARLDAERRAREEAERIRAALMAELAAMVNFDFDRSDIRSVDMANLDRKAAILAANTGVRLRIAGHCDERGSDEYNLALGNRRASSTKRYLVNKGIDASRIEIASFGEERPLDSGSNESAWARNRRSEFEITGGGATLVAP
ncbi:MAG: OmpA family protein [Gemmatimonadales bacterium]|nr:OmpA family protein [Gemmatimonadales bacterium]